MRTAPPSPSAVINPCLTNNGNCGLRNCTFTAPGESACAAFAAAASSDSLAIGLGVGLGALALLLLIALVVFVVRRQSHTSRRAAPAPLRQFSLDNDLTLVSERTA